MSDTTTKVGYRLSIQYLDSGGVQHTFTDTDGWTDENALALMTYLMNAPWPQAQFQGLVLEKLVTVFTDAVVDLTVLPLAFPTS